MISLNANETIPTMLSDEGGSYSDSDDDVSSYLGDRPYDEEEAEDEHKDKEEISSRLEQKAKSVGRWYDTINGIFAIVAVGFTLGTFAVVLREETHDFQNAFDRDVDSMENAWHLLWRSITEATDGLCDHVALADSYNNNNNNSSWPLVTVPHFEVHASRARAQIQSDLVFYSPLVADSARSDWESYSVENQKLWVVPNHDDRSHGISVGNDVANNNTGGISSEIYRLERGVGHRTAAPEEGPGPYAPVWQISPPPSLFPPAPTRVNFNILSDPVLGRLVGVVLDNGDNRYYSDDQPKIVLSEVTDLDYLYDNTNNGGENNNHSAREQHLRAIMMRPIVAATRQTTTTSTEVVGTLQIVMTWDNLISDLLPEGRPGMIAILKNSCGQEFAYEISGGGRALLLPPEYTRDTHFDKYERIIDLNNNNTNGIHDKNKIACGYSLHVYPSDELRSESQSDHKRIFIIVLFFMFVLVGLVFYAYQKNVEASIKEVIQEAERSNAVIKELFPSNVRDRLFEEGRKDASTGEEPPDNDPAGLFDRAIRYYGFPGLPPLPGFAGLPGFRGLPGFLMVNNNHHHNHHHHNHHHHRDDPEPGDPHNSEEGDGALRADEKPIADLFPNATVLFADIVGFTAWSSVREPTQVFTLLETLYHAFDIIAKRRKVFKVETIGDCYVAATGLPIPQKDHAVVMARFARDCTFKVSELTKRLEITLGPGTGELTMRFGMHSGPVTAGVLRGDRSRFQLFGDTVNTACRMESSGKGNQIHISQATNDELTMAGKTHWVEPREDKVMVKGKGAMQTYWLNIVPPIIRGESSRNLLTGDQTDSSDDEFEELLRSQHHDEDETSGSSDRLSRLISWNVDVLSNLLKLIVARRRAAALGYRRQESDDSEGSESNSTVGVELATVLEEVKEIITLPKFDAKAARKQEDPDLVELDEDVQEQLRDYVITIAAFYHDNPFHNFDHASHVTMSIVKLLSRIVRPMDDNEIVCRAGKMDDNEIVVRSSTKKDEKMKKKIASRMHDNTYGITSDPLTQFAVVFSGLIHDVDHTGVPNAQLIKENLRIAALYKNKSVAEQNSVDIAWSLLMEPDYEDLRAVIYCNESELKRFRQLVVNCVMATDIVDKELKELRNARWDRAFRKKSDHDDDDDAAAAAACSNNEGGDAPAASCRREEEDATATGSHEEDDAATGSNEDDSSATTDDGVDMLEYDYNYYDDDDNVEDEDKAKNRKATIVIEHLIQASDVAHTMQHWHVYRKWNERLFHEMYRAFQRGRSDNNPADFWYKGEMGFFDFYIIPLAKKLAECGVFGVSSDEYLNYALENRMEWEQRGEEVVIEMLQTAEEMYRSVPKVRRRKSMAM